MSRKQIDAILWRQYLAATSHAVWKVSTSQYYFELPDRRYQDFFGGNCRSFTDKDANEAFTIRLEALDGAEPVAEHEVTFTKKRASASRDGKWTADSIRDGKTVRAYDLWREKRGPLKRYEHLDPDEKEKNYIVVARDIDGRFHGRWIRGADFDALPISIQKILMSGTAGWRKL